MWRPILLEKKQGIISRWLEQRRKRIGSMDSTQFHWKQIHHIKDSQEPLRPDERTRGHIPKEAKTAYPGEKAIEIRFCATQTPTQAQVYIYAARKDDDIVEVASGFMTTGLTDTRRKEQRCYYVEKILIEDNWLSPVGVVKGRIMFRTHGYHRFFVRLKFESSSQWFVDMVGCDLW